MRDVERLAEHIALDSPESATKVARSLIAAGDSLSEFPLRGRVSRFGDTREFVAFRPYVIVYRVTPDVEVTIVRVLHAAQDR